MACVKTGLTIKTSHGELWHGDLYAIGNAYVFKYIDPPLKNESREPWAELDLDGDQFFTSAGKNMGLAIFPQWHLLHSAQLLEYYGRHFKPVLEEPEK